MDRMGWFQMNYQKQMVDFFFSFFSPHIWEDIHILSPRPPEKVTGDLKKKTFE